MNSVRLRTLWLPLILAFAVVLLDRAAHALNASQVAVDLAHLFLGAAVLAVTARPVLQAVRRKHVAGAALGQVEAEREAQAGNQTSELESVTPGVSASMSEHKLGDRLARLTGQHGQTDGRDVEALLRALPVAAVLTDAKGGVILTNDMYEEIWGPRPGTQEVADYGQYRAWWADTGLPVEPHEWASARAVERGESVLGQVLQIERFDGGRRFVVNSAVPVRDQEGRVAGSAVVIHDITDLRRAEQALRESEERFRTVIENSRDGINMLDLRTGRYVFMSPAQVKLTGYTAEEMANLPAEEAYERVHPDDREISISQQKLVAEGGDPSLTVEYRWKVKSGEYRWFSDSRKVVRDSQGRAIALVGVSRDITEQRLAADALRASEEKYRLLFHNMTEGFALYELVFDDRGEPVDWRVLEVNEAYARHTGIPREVITGRRMGEVFPAAIPQYLPRFVNVVKTQTASSFESFSETVGRYQHVTTFPAGPNRFANIIEDISERRRAEIEVERQAAILAQLNDAVVVLDAEGRVTFWNAAAERVYGYTASEALGKPVDFFPEPTFIGTTREEVAARVTEYGEANVETARLTKDGRRVWIESRVRMMRNGAGEPAGMMWVDRDVTARIEAQETLRRVEAEWAFAAQERAALEERQRLARELHDSVSQSLYSIGLAIHAALGQLEIDPTRTRGPLDFALSLATTAHQEMRALIFDLWPATLADEGLVSALRKQVKQLGMRRGVQIELELDEEPLLPLGAKEALYRIAQEALVNAIKHARASHLILRLEHQPGGYSLEVLDNGVGFDPEGAFPGHLGLRSMRERAALVGGILEIESAPDTGTRIRTLIPEAARTSQ